MYSNCTSETVVAEWSWSQTRSWRCRVMTSNSDFRYRPETEGREKHNGWIPLLRNGNYDCNSRCREETTPIPRPWSGSPLKNTKKEPSCCHNLHK
ncbi:hypothetical protein TNCV_304201 [Trichonephila clavipes]|nr:hypothetical protein TNCV_304201 [Trichonephila clavipes]